MAKFDEIVNKIADFEYMSGNITVEEKVAFEEDDALFSEAEGFGNGLNMKIARDWAEKNSGSQIEWMYKLPKAYKTLQAAETAAAVAVASVALGAGVRSIVKKFGSNDAKAKRLLLKVEKLNAKAAELKKNGGDKKEIAALKAEANQLAKEAEALAKESANKVDKAIKESSDDSIRLEIFESCRAGEITEEERDDLLLMI